MIIIIGLGNPEKRYARARHNAGWLMLDFLRGAWGAPQWRTRKQLMSLITKVVYDKKTVILVKPLTSMNKSGEAVQRVKKFFKAKNQELWIVHDELDLPLGTMKISFKRGTAGHNGVTSIVRSLKNDNFYRWRIGIGPDAGNTTQYVLSPFTNKEFTTLKTVFSRAHTSIERALMSSPEDAMIEINKKKGV